MNKFADWMKCNDKKQRGVAQKLGISTSTLHDILRRDQVPSLKIAYEIEKYTSGAITVYDWMDHIKITERTSKDKIKKAKKNTQKQKA